MTGETSSPVLIHASWRNSGRRPRILSRVARPSPSPLAHGASRARAVRPRAAPPGRARGQGSAPIVPRCYCHQCGRHPPLHADVRTARRRGRRGRRGTRHGRHRRDGRDGRRRRRGRHNQLPSLRGRSAPRTGQLYHGQTGLTAVASCRSMPCRLRSKRFIFFCLFGKLWIKIPPLSSGLLECTAFVRACNRLLLARIRSV